MPTFLELCQAVARESGTVDGVRPASVLNQTGREGKIVNWVRQAWIQIQNSRSDWSFMRQEALAQIGEGGTRVTAQSLGISDFSRWMTDLGHYRPHSAFRSESPDDEWPLFWVTFELWRTRFGRGVQRPGMPQFYSVSPSEELCIGPPADRQYELRLEYYRASQVLQNNDDVPIMPERFHNAIMWRAVMFLDQHDEATPHIQNGRGALEYRNVYYDMVREMAPTLTV